MTAKLWQRRYSELQIALRLLNDNRLQSGLTLLGIVGAVAVIVFITALIEGLQSNLIERTLGTQAHIRIESPEAFNQPAPQSAEQLTLDTISPRPQRLRDIPQWPAVLQQLQADAHISAVAPLLSGPALASRGLATRSVVLLGVRPDSYLSIIPIDQSLLSGQWDLSPGHTVIGKQLAYELGVVVGDRIFIDAGQNQRTRLQVSGIFELGVKELDARYAYLDLKQAQALLNLKGGISSLEVRLEDPFLAPDLAAELELRTALNAQSWTEQNQQLLNALRSQSMSTQLIKFFVGVSALFAITSVLAITVVQRRREIGILRAMGASRGQVVRIFLNQGLVFGITGAILGSAVAALLLDAMTRFGPNLFTPALTFKLVVSTLITATLCGVLAALIPALQAARLDPAEAIRHA